MAWKIESVEGKDGQKNYKCHTYGVASGVL